MTKAKTKAPASKKSSAPKTKKAAKVSKPERAMADASATSKVPQEVSKRCGGKACKIQNCAGEYKAKGYCRSHYKDWRQGKYGVARYKICSDNECRSPQARDRHGLCENHYQSYYVKGIERAKAPAPAAPEKSEKAA